MFSLPTLFLVICILSFTNGSPSMTYLGGGDDLYSESVNFMAPRMEGKKVPHSKDIESDIKEKTAAEFESPFDYSKFEAYLNNVNEAAADPSSPEHNRIKRHAKRRRLNKKRTRTTTTTAGPDDTENKNGTTTEVPIARHGDDSRRSSQKKKKPRLTDDFAVYNSPLRDFESNFVEMPKDLYQAHLRPGVIFRIHMSEAIIKMQYRNYGEDKDESVIEADVEYLRLTRKVINDEITKFEDLKWLVNWFNNRSELIMEHVCNTKYLVVGTPPTMFTHTEEYMKRLCLFDNVYIDHIPYVIGEDSSLMAAVAPPVLHCDAATCTSVPFIDSMMFDERLSRTNVRTMTRCQASCRAHCKNNPDCLKRCSDRCLRPE